MQALLLQYFLFVCLFVFCTNCTYSVCKFPRGWYIAGANRAENKTHCKSGVYMKRLPNGNVKNVMVFSALVNCTKGLSCFRKQIVTQFPEQPSFPKCSFKQHQLSLAQSRANVRMASRPLKHVCCVFPIIVMNVEWLWNPLDSFVICFC